MAINFPDSPTVGQSYTVNLVTWVYDGTKWKGSSSTAAIADLTGGVAGAAVYQAATNDTAFTAAGTSGQVLLSGGTSSPTWSNTLASVTSVNGSTVPSTQTLVGRTTTDTLTNKTLTSPALTGAALESFNATTGFAGYTLYATTNGAIHTLWNTQATANGVVNITSTVSQTLNTLMVLGQVLTVTLVINNGSTAYYPTSVTIDGAAPSAIKWAGGTAPTSGNANSYDTYTFTILKAGAPNWNVLASQTKFA